MWRGRLGCGSSLTQAHGGGAEPSIVQQTNSAMVVPGVQVGKGFSLLPVEQWEREEASERPDVLAPCGQVVQRRLGVVSSPLDVVIVTPGVLHHKTGQLSGGQLKKRIRAQMFDRCTGSVYSLDSRPSNRHTAGIPSGVCLPQVEPEG